MKKTERYFYPAVFTYKPEQEIAVTFPEVMNHQFNWWFDYAPIRGLCLQRLKGGCLKHLYRLASKRGYLLVSSLFDSSFCC